MSERMTRVGLTTYLRGGKRNPTAKHDGMAAWLKDQIEYLERIARTEFGDGALFAYRSALQEIER